VRAALLFQALFTVSILVFIVFIVFVKGAANITPEFIFSFLPLSGRFSLQCSLSPLPRPSA
jgi:hypothetical protein